MVDPQVFRGELWRSRVDFSKPVGCVCWSRHPDIRRAEICQPYRKEIFAGSSRADWPKRMTKKGLNYSSKIDVS